MSFAYKNCDGAIPTPGELTPDDNEMLNSAAERCRGCESLRTIYTSIASHNRRNLLVQQANRYIDTQAPWALRKDRPGAYADGTVASY